jgi:hypothetical protein
MSWTFCHGAKKSEIIEALTLFSVDRVLRHIERGNSLWMVKLGPDTPPYIVCFLLTRDENRIWGYQELREATGTPLNCPLELFDIAPIMNRIWRQRVTQFHADHSKKPAVGEVWSLKRSRIPHIAVSEVAPQLKGYYAGELHTIKPSNLAERLRAAQ